MRKTPIRFIIMRHLHLFLFCLAVSYCSFSFSQEKLGDKIKNSTLAYFDEVKDMSPLFIGRNENLPPTEARGGMYLRQKGFREYNNWGKLVNNPTMPNRASFSVGELNYNGIFYPSVNLRLDIVNDVLVVLSPDNTHSLVLDERVFESATFNGYKIVYLKNIKSINNGYYLNLYDGKDNSIYEKISANYSKNQQKYSNQSHKYYIKQKGEFRQIKSKNNLLKLFPTHKKELDNYIKSNKLQFKDNFGDDMVAVVNEYMKQVGL